MTRERPILFSGEMVRAIICGRKTQTRRVVHGPIPSLAQSAHVVVYDDGTCAALWPDIWDRSTSNAEVKILCPYGAPGDLLWVRERMRVIGVRGDNIRVCYEADGAESDWLPYPDRLIGEPMIGKCLTRGGHREASRITLRATDVRVERIHRITGEDARAEGVQSPVTTDGCPRTPDAEPPTHDDLSRLAFSVLWDKINAARGCGWDAKPWVWVVAFEGVQGG